ncbi:uncharacterized protein LOC113311438 [Papaver somniferum]|uniref:uncharacterized protein LOC113311438 n=1 Tax=Papaver somniferum TaxID=3469 RepID=UPI000E6F767A|nr:uncharacterized protein LOC113311438 [Papaver somniferum]
MLDLIFQRRIPTTVSIPPPCRLQFSRTLKTTLDNVLAKPQDLVAWLRLLLLPVCILNLYMPKSSAKEKSGTRKKLQIAAINQALVTWLEPNGCFTLVQKLLDLSMTNNQRKQSTKGKKKDANLQACRKKLSYGHYIAALRVLSSNGVAPSTPDTLYELQQKHSSAPPPVIPLDNISAAALSVNSNSVLHALKSFPKGTACGRDGLRAQHLLDALSGAAAAVSDELLHSIITVVNLWLDGRCHTVLGEYVASAPLTPLLKPGGGLRPIAVGTIWRRLCSKLAATSVCKDMTSYLGNYRFDVGIPCGSEGILHSANKLVELKGGQDNMSMLLIDFTNALIWWIEPYWSMRSELDALPYLDGSSFAMQNQLAFITMTQSCHQQKEYNKATL